MYHKRRELMITAHRLQLSLAFFVVFSLGWLCIENVRAEKWEGVLLRYEPPNPVVAVRPFRAQSVHVPAGTAHGALNETQIASFNAINPSLSSAWIVDPQVGGVGVPYVRILQPKSNLGNHILHIAVRDTNTRLFIDAARHLELAAGATHTLIYDPAQRTWIG